VLEGNPDASKVFVYRKLKHLNDGESAIAALAGRASMLWTLRRRRLDLAIIAAGEQDIRGERLARLLSPARIVRSGPPIPGQHEVERTLTAARMLGFTGPTPPLRVSPIAVAAHRIHSLVGLSGLKRPLIGVHISARREAQRWPAAYFAEFIKTLRDVHGASTLLFWSPGAEGHPQHPGDDGKAATIMNLVGSTRPPLACPTSDLASLIAGLAECDAIVCSDGGAMHLAAGLGKPIACFFGDSPVERWRPWGVPHVVLQAPSHRVKDVAVEEAVHAVTDLLYR
jgi:ADP-heptose:LPS heptosyltransferase